MAGKDVAGEGVSANITGMSKNQLYDIMCQMKKLMEQNEKQAKQILVQNPTLARDLFQAQILLGMVQPTQIDKPAPATQSTQPLPSSHIQQPVAAVSSPQLNPQDQVRKPYQTQVPISVPAVGAPPSLPMHHHPIHSVQQPKATPVSVAQPVQPHPNKPPPLPHHPLDQPMHSSGVQHLPPLQPPLPPQMRPSAQPFSQQIHPQMGFQQAGPPPQMHHSQPMFHGGKPPGPMGPSFMMQGQPPLPSQPPPQALYQGGGSLSHIRPEFNHIGSSMGGVDRGGNPAWIPGLLPDNNTQKAQLPGLPPPFPPAQMGPANQPPRQPPLTPEMEQALLLQVMSLTPEQINLLPPDQRTQVLQLQQLLRK